MKWDLLTGLAFPRPHSFPGGPLIFPALMNKTKLPPKRPELAFIAGSNCLYFNSINNGYFPETLNMYISVCLCGGMCTQVQMPVEARFWISWNWSYRLL